MLFFPPSLHNKFLVFVIGSLILLFGVLTYVIVEREARLLVQKDIEKQHIMAQAIVADLQKSMLEHRPRSILELLKRLREASGVVRLEVVDSDGKRAFGIAGERLFIQQFDQVFSAGTEVDFSETGEPPVHTIVYPLKNDTACRNCHGSGKRVLGAVLVSYSMEDSIREIEQSKRDLTSVLFIIIFLIGCLLYFITRIEVLRPLATLHNGAERIGKGDLAHRINVSTGDELQDVARAFNTMAGRLEESYGGLESRVRERTTQLRQAMEDVRSKAIRLYRYSRDMATISQLSTKVFNTDLSLDELLDSFMTGVSRGLGYQQAMLCLVDRNRVWLDVKRDSGLTFLLPATGLSLLSDNPFMNIVRSGEVQILDERTADTFGLGDTIARLADQRRDLYCIPLVKRIHGKKCSQIMSCIKTDCPAYDEHTRPCWLVDHTLCGNPIIESYQNKLAYCMTCAMFPVIGILVVSAGNEERGSRSRNLRVLRILAAEMAAALENHRLHAENQQIVRELLELHRVTASALADLSLSKALDVFTDSALKFAEIDACAFWLMSPDGRELARVGGSADTSKDKDAFPDRLPVGEGLIGQAMGRQSSFVINYNVSRSDTTLLSNFAAAQGLHALIAVPLKNKDGPLGVFSAHRRNAAPFLESEIAALMLLANQAAMAINVCKLNEELKDHNRELARRTNLLSGILSSMSSGIMLLDATGTVTLINEVGAGILRSRREDLINQRLTDLHPEMDTFVTSTVGPYQEIDIRLADGSLAPIGFSSTYYRGLSEEQEGVIVVFRDLSELKALRSELMNKERFAAMGRVVAGAAHEIRNPLFGISSVGQILERELVDPAHRELVRALLSETKRLNELVEELLVYGRPMTLRQEDCDVAALWREVLDMHRDELARLEIGFLGDPHFRPVQTYLDANQIRQVFLNLLRNAIDATPPRGTITLQFLLDNRYIIIKLTDTGMGIPADNKDKIFDLFFTTRPKGTGLGLAICKKIVQDHGGEIAIESAEGKGTSVTIKLPHRGTAGKTNIPAALPEREPGRPIGNSNNQRVDV